MNLGKCEYSGISIKMLSYARAQYAGNLRRQGKLERGGTIVEPIPADCYVQDGWLILARGETVLGWFQVLQSGKIRHWSTKTQTTHPGGGR